MKTLLAKLTAKIGCLSRLVKPKKTLSFNPQRQGFPPAVFLNSTDRIMPEQTIGREFDGPDGKRWKVLSFEQDEHRDLLPADGVMTIQQV